MAYTGFDYKILLAQLKQNSKSKNKNYNKEDITYGSDFLYGVSISKLREISIRIINRDWKGFLNVAKDDSFEEVMLQGMVIAGADCSIHEKLAYTERFVSKVNNWAICDTFCFALKDARKFKVETWNFLMRFIDSRKPYERRFVVTMLSNYFLIDDFINDALRVIVNMNRRNEIVMDAVTSALSVSFVKYKVLVMGILKDRILDPQTHNHTIKKCMNSYRITNEDKIQLRKLILRADS